MHPDETRERFSALTTPHIADACLRSGAAVRCGPAALVGVGAGDRLAGRVLPVRHAGSVDIFLEAYESAEPGDVLVVDNGGRPDEACVGDLAVLEARSAGLSGLVIWGLHRDSVDIRAIGLPVFSLGSLPTGPQRVDPRPEHALDRARVGEWVVTTADAVFADEDGVVFVDRSRLAEILEAAESIRDTERRQADLIRDGVGLRDQVEFRRFLEDRERMPSLTFREHLRSVGGAIEV